MTTMNTLTVEDAKRQREILQRTIASEIADFEQITGCELMAVCINRTRVDDVLTKERIARGEVSVEVVVKL